MTQDPPFEDELGDVLEKALRLRDLTEDDLAEATGIDVGRIKDALDYRYDLTARELAGLAKSLGLNEVGLQALADGRYPLPSPSCLPYCLHVISMPYGVGVVNAYVVCRCGADRGLLFDSGVSPRAMDRAWPPSLALSVSSPNDSSISQAIMRFTSLSSTTRIDAVNFRALTDS